MSNVRVRNVRPKPGYVFDGRSVTRMPTNDGLSNVLTGRGTSVDRSMHNVWLGMSMPAQQIEAAYRSSWLVRQIVDIPAQDQTRAGRDWDADEEQIEKIEAEEKRLGYWSKVRQALIFGRLGGGVLFINLGDNPAAPLPNTIRPEQIVSLIPLYRTQITLGLPDDDVLSPYFNEPVDFALNTPSRPKIHRTRLIFFKGQAVPGFSSVNWDDRFWGDSVVQVVNEAVQNATTATAGFSALIDEAKVDVFKFDKLAETLVQPGGDAKIRKRIDLATVEKSIHRSISLDGADEWETRTLNFAGAKDMITTLYGIAAGAADIPATRLLGKSPDGMNASGQGDLDNYFQSVSARQESELRPSLDQLDAVVMPSAGVPSDLSWKFSPLQHLSEKDEAEIENKEADTVSKYVTSALVPESALAKAVQNRMIESGRWPGLKEGIEEAEAAGEDLPDDDLDIVPVPKGGDPTSTGEGGANGSVPPRRAANDGFFADAQPRPLYVQRKLLNAAALIGWAKSNGFTSTLPADDMHVTVLYSRTAVDPMKMGEGWSGDDKGHVRVKPGGPRAIERLGESAVVLLFASSDIQWRHQAMVEAGGSHDFPEYQPHVTISFDVPADFDLDALKPYAGALEFGPELFEPLDLDWKSKLSEA